MTENDYLLGYKAGLKYALKCLKKEVKNSITLSVKTVPQMGRKGPSL